MNKVVITGLVFGFIGAQRTWSQSVAPHWRHLCTTFYPLAAHPRRRRVRIRLRPVRRSPQAKLTMHWLITT